MKREHMDRIFDILIDIQSKIEYYLSPFINGFRNLKFWLPVIWKDACWDSEFLIIILRHKLLQMEQFWGSDKPTVMGAKKTHRQIKTCRILCDRVLNGVDPNVWDEKGFFGQKQDPIKTEFFYRRRSMEYLGKMIAKHHSTWWN